MAFALQPQLSHKTQDFKFIYISPPVENEPSSPQSALSSMLLQFENSSVSLQMNRVLSLVKACFAKLIPIVFGLFLVLVSVVLNEVKPH